MKREVRLVTDATQNQPQHPWSAQFWVPYPAVVIGMAWFI